MCLFVSGCLVGFAGLATYWVLPLKGGNMGNHLAHAFSVTADLLAHSYGGVCQQIRGTLPYNYGRNMYCT